MEASLPSIALLTLFNLSSGEIVLVLALLLILFGARHFPYLARGLGTGWREKDGELGFFKRAVQAYLDEMGRDPKFHRPAYTGEPRSRSSAVGGGWRLFIAQGFGIGRIPFAPGTFGTVLGMVWFVLLVLTGKLWLFIAGVIASIALSVWLCGEAEKILQQHDPPSVVLDEIIAIPICFLPWVVSAWQHLGAMPPVETFFSAKTWWISAVLFALFRVFDILKPPPIRQSQRLPGGWGVTVDDALAAVCVALLSLLVIS